MVYANQRLLNFTDTLFCVFPHPIRSDVWGEKVSVALEDAAGFQHPRSSGLKLNNEDSYRAIYTL